MELIPQFSGKHEDWPPFITQLKYFFVVFNITDTHKRLAYLLGFTGPHTRELAECACFPDSSFESLLGKTYEEVCERVTALIKSYRSIHVEMYKFDNRYQKPSESFNDYYDDLRRLASTCEFGKNLDKELLRRILCGIHDLELKRILLAMRPEELTLECAVEKILLWESAQQFSIGEAQAANNASAVQESASMPPLPLDSCFRCGNPTKHNCPKRNSICCYCRKRGHIESVCLLKRGHVN